LEEQQAGVLPLRPSVGGLSILGEKRVLERAISKGWQHSLVLS